MNFDFRKRPLDLLCSSVKGGAFSSGNSILMQRERGKKKETRAKTEKGAVGKIGGRKRAAPGRERAANEKRQRGSKLSNKQEKAKGKAQESRHQNRFPPLFDRAPPFTFEHKRSRDLFRKSKLHSFNLQFFA